MKSLFSSVKQSVNLFLSMVVLATLGMPLLMTGSASAAISHDTRYNWSGYVATGHTYNKVQGDIRVPTVTCTVANAETEFWVGFDGFSSGSYTVEQAGVDAKCVGKVPHYYAFWEMMSPYKNSAVNHVSLAVKPGDRIATVVSYASSKFEMQIVNTTTNKRIAPVYQTCAKSGTCVRNSADWVAERNYTNSSTQQYAPLAKFGYSPTLFAYAEAATSTNAKLTAISGFNAIALNMVNTKYTNLDAVSSLGGGGTTFGVTWYAAQ